MQTAATQHQNGCENKATGPTPLPKPLPLNELRRAAGAGCEMSAFLIVRRRDLKLAFRFVHHVSFKPVLENSSKSGRLLADCHQDHARSQAPSWDSIAPKAPPIQSLQFPAFPSGAVGTRRWRSGRSVKFKLVFSLCGYRLSTKRPQ